MLIFNLRIKGIQPAQGLQIIYKDALNLGWNLLQTDTYLIHTTEAHFTTVRYFNGHELISIF